MHLEALNPRRSKLPGLGLGGATKKNEPESSKA